MRHIFRKSSFVALIFSVIWLGESVRAQESHPSELTASDLGDILSIHWWMVKLPDDLGPKDTVETEIVSSDGKRVDGGGGLMQYPSKIKLGNRIRVFCWEDEAAHTAKVSIKSLNGSVTTANCQDYFQRAGISGPGNGTVMSVGDILLKFDSARNASFSSDNFLYPGQFGLKVVITHGH